MKEFWRPVVGREQHYEVSNFSRIKNLHTGLIMKQTLKDEKYLCVRLAYDNPKVVYVHKIVADAFPEVCGVYFHGAQVDHLNTNKTNNFFLNLKYKSVYDNRHNPITEFHSVIPVLAAKKANMIPLIERDDFGNVIKEWCSQTEAAQYYGVNKSSICRAMKNGTKCVGHYWEEENKAPQ